MGLADDLFKWFIGLGIAMIGGMIAGLRKLTLAERQIKENTNAISEHERLCLVERTRTNNTLVEIKEDVAFIRGRFTERDERGES